MSRVVHFSTTIVTFSYSIVSLISYTCCRVVTRIGFFYVQGTELLQKQRVETDSESEEEDDEEDGASDFDINSDDAEEEREVSASSKSNPWMSSSKITCEFALYSN